MAGIRAVISTLMNDGREVMRPDVLMWHYPNNDIMNGSLLTVESNQFCLLKSHGCRPETRARQPNPRECRQFSQSRKSNRRDRTGWLRMQSNAYRSPEINSAITGKFTGNFANSGSWGRFFAAINEQIQLLTDEIPYSTEQGTAFYVSGNS
jgi:hypothetical protein